MQAADPDKELLFASLVVEDAARRELDVPCKNYETCETRSMGIPGALSRTSRNLTWHVQRVGLWNRTRPRRRRDTADGRRARRQGRSRDKETRYVGSQPYRPTCTVP
jgi:hypothetical protein